MATTVTVSVKGQIALPAEVRRKLGITGGSRLLVETSGNAVILRPAKSGKKTVRKGKGIVPNTAGQMSIKEMDERVDQALRKGEL
jgi:AbrB family looped-hinge helix DNA binding protein